MYSYLTNMKFKTVQLIIYELVTFLIPQLMCLTMQIIL